MALLIDQGTFELLSRQLRRDLLSRPFMAPLTPELEGRLAAELGALEAGRDPYIEEADANPERRGNGCMIYRQSS